MTSWPTFPKKVIFSGVAQTACHGARNEVIYFKCALEKQKRAGLKIYNTLNKYKCAFLKKNRALMTTYSTINIFECA